MAKKLEDILGKEKVEEIISFYLFPHSLRETARNFDIARSSLKNLLLRHIGRLHVAELTQKLGEELEAANNIEKYGTPFYTDTEEFKQKVSKTFFEKYNVNNIGELSHTKEISSKIKQTNLERYGVEFVSQAEQIKEKVKQTNIEHIGVENYLQTDDGKARMAKAKLAHYGDINYNNREKANETSLQRFGVKHYTQTLAYHHNL